MNLFATLLIGAAMMAPDASLSSAADRLPEATALRAARTAPKIEVPAALITLIEQVDVSASEAGILSGVSAKEGQLVTEGTPLAQIYDADARIDAEHVKIELAMAKKAAENDIKIRFAKKSTEVAKAELDRSLASVKRYPRSISDSELDRLRLIVEKSTLEAEQAEQEFELAAFAKQIKESECQAADEKLARHKILAPLAGVVVQINRRRGEWVKPGDTVVRILRLDHLRVEGFIKAQAVDHNLQDAKVRLFVNVPGAGEVEFPGKVVFLSPEIDPVNGQMRIWAEIENQGLRLRPGMRAKMVIDERAK